jgi:uncharacterized repeat protein (TIGR03806 family)
MARLVSALGVVRMALAAAVVASFAACASDGDGPIHDDGGLTDASPVDASADVPRPPTRAPFGLDARPKNATCKVPERPPSPTPLAVELISPALPGIIFPVGIFQAPDDPAHFYVLEHSEGKVVRVGSSVAASTVEDVVTVPIVYENELGILGLAFDPQWTTNRRVYLSYVTTGGSLPGGYRMVVARLQANATLDTFTFDREVFSYDQPGFGHAGGTIEFGPDGNLYLAPGDGLVTQERVQDPGYLQGKVLRIHLENDGSYTIPPTNPYASGGGRPEVFASGFRNPWRFSFDRATGDLWVGDVGESSYEEIDRVELGGNYGWPVREGAHCHEPQENCPTAGLVDPVYEYAHGSDLAVVGGFVYRGSKIPSLHGTYVFADFYSGKIYGLGYDAAGAPSVRELADAKTPISSLGQAADGELVMTGFNSWLLYKLVATGPQPIDTFPDRLSKTGCAMPGRPLDPAPGLVPYDVNAPFWSDGADKRRYLALPDDATIAVGKDGDFDLPVGSVLRKDFTLGGKRIETRLFMRHQDGDWAGYSYAWDDAETDATLVRGGKTAKVAGGNWAYPSSGQCLQCHTKAAGRTLGLELAQLNRDFVYTATNRVSNQLATLDHIGLLAAKVGDPQALPALPDPSGAGPVDARARAYLHTNCSFCHRPEGPGRGTANWLYDTPWASAGACDVEPVAGDLGVAGARLVKPGAPDQSLALLRLRSQNAARMPPFPPLGSRRLDASGSALLDTWIRGLSTCPAK